MSWSVGGYRGWVRTVLAVGLLTAFAPGCSGKANPASPERRAKECAAYSTLLDEETRLRAIFPPMALSQVAGLEAERASVVDAVAAAAEPRLRGDMTRFVEVDHASGKLLLENWGTDGTAVLQQADEHDYPSLFAWLSRDGVRVSHSQTLNTEQANDTSAVAHDDLWLACRAGDWRPLANDTNLSLPANTLAYVSNRTAIALATLTGSAPSAAPPIQDSHQKLYPSFAPDGHALVYQSSGAVWLAAADLTNPHQVSPPDHNWICPSWLPDSTGLLVARQLQPGAWTLARVRLADGATTDLTSPTPFRLVPCARSLSSSLLVSTTRNETTHTNDLVLRNDNGGIERPFTQMAGCNFGDGTPSPDGTHVLVNVTCTDQSQDGTWISTASGTDLRHVIVGHTAAPAWTADGHNIVFGYVAFGQSETNPELWIATSDGAHARRLRPAWASWPALTGPPTA